MKKQLILMIFNVFYCIGLNGSPVIGKSHIISITNKTDAIIFMNIVFAQPCREIQATIGANTTVERATDCWPIAIRWGFKQDDLQYEKFVGDLTSDQLHMLQISIDNKDDQARIGNKPISELQFTIQKQLQKIWPAYFYE